MKRVDIFKSVIYFDKWCLNIRSRKFNQMLFFRGDSVKIVIDKYKELKKIHNL